MNAYDFSPLFRSSVGFDRMARLMDASLQGDRAGSGFPPYNIVVVGEDHYRITMAVAGFREEDLSIEVHNNALTVTGTIASDDTDVEYLHRGIAERNFTRKFQLAEYVEVAEAGLENGLLTIDLERRVPEAKKPRTIEIASGAPKTLTSKAKKLLDSKAKAA